MNAIDTTEYDALPESIKQNYTLSGWLWLTDTEKAHLMETECEPEKFKD